jgi:cold shock CspA family protein
MRTLIAVGDSMPTDPYVKAARLALERLSTCAAFHGHTQLIYPDLRHDIEVMARHRDIKKICLNFTEPTGRVIVGPYVVTVTAGKYRLAVPVQAAARIPLGGAGQAKLTVHRNGHENSYRHLLRLPWPEASVLERRYPGVVTEVRADRSGVITDRFGHTAYLPRGENRGFRAGQQVTYSISRNRQGVIAGNVMLAPYAQRAA